MNEVAISLNNVSKCFKRYRRPVDRLKEILLPGKSHAEEFWALREISLEVGKGSTLGIIGQNGSGKSTLLQIIAGTLTPSSGQVSVQGRVSALLELGSGFNAEFTGRQNVFFNGRLLGLSQVELDRKFDDIAAFAEIGDFIDQPVKTYSSGMFVRLAFSVAINVDPDILIVDEALAVGDIFFQAKCYRKIQELQEKGVTILFVSHDATTIQTLCDEGILLHHGYMICRDTPSVISSKYFQVFRSEHEQIKPVEAIGEVAKPQTTIEVSYDRRITNGKATIQQVYVTNLDDEPQTTFSVGQTIKGVLIIEFHETCYDVTAGFGFRDRYGKLLFGKHSWYEDPSPLPIVSKGETVEFVFTLTLDVQAGEYLALVGAGGSHRTESEYESLDVLQDAFVINVVGQNQVWGVVQVPGSIQVQRKTIMSPTAIMAE